MSDLIGQSLGRYHILEPLGEGGMAIVYKAYDTRLERDVAVKVIRTEKLTLETMGKTLKRFEREAKALAKLTHPNIVPITDYGEHDEKPYLVMPYLPGGTLKQQLKGKPLPWEDSVRLLIPIARALHYAHQQGIIHRDVKPSNILITQSGEPMLTDFGIAKILLDNEDTADLTGTGMGVGTPEYMSPEQFQGKGVDARTDVYSLGVVLYEMITGRKPYQADTPAAVLVKQVTEPLPRPKSFVPNLPDAVEKTLLKALAKEKENRYEDVAVFGNAMEIVLTRTDREKQSVERETPTKSADKQDTFVQGESNAKMDQEIETENLLHRTRSSTWKNVLWIILGWIIGLAIGGAIGLVVDDAFYGIEETIGWIISWTIGLAIGGAIMVWRIRKLSIAQKQHRQPRWIWGMGIGLIGAVLLMGIFAISFLLNGSSSSPTPMATSPTSTIVPTNTFIPTPTLFLSALVGTAYPQPQTVISPENADQVVQLARWGKGSVEQATFSPDGRLLAVASSIGVYLYDTETLAEVLFIETGVIVSTVAFSPDGQTLASGGWDSTVRLWQVLDGTLLRTLGYTNYVDSVAFSPDGQIVAAGDRGDIVRLWRVADGTLLHTLEGHTGMVRSVSFSPDGQTLASGSDDNTVRLWRVADGTLIRIFEGHTDRIFSVAFSPDGYTLASGSDDDTVRLWRASDGTLLRTLDGYTSDVRSVAFSPDGITLASGDWDNNVLLWRVSDGSLLRTLEGHSSLISNVAFSPDGATLASVSSDNTVRLWRVSDGSLQRTLEGYSGSVNSVAFSPDGQTLASVSDKTMLWQVSDGTLLHNLDGSEDVWGVVFSPDGLTLASASYDSGLQLWRVSDGELLYTLEGQTKWVHSVAFSLDGQTLASGFDDNTVRLWRVSDGELLYTLHGHTDTVQSVIFSPDGQTLASGSGDNTVRLWRVSDGELLYTLHGHTDTVQSVIFSPDGQTLASGSDDNTVRLWRVSDGELLYTLHGHTDIVRSVIFSPDGQTLASGSGDNTVRLWRVSDGGLLYTLEGGGFEVAFSPDGNVLASSYDGTIRLWDPTTSKELAILRGDSDGVYNIVFSPDGKILVSGGFDGTLRLWGILP